MGRPSFAVVAVAPNLLAVKRRVRILDTVAAARRVGMIMDQSDPAGSPRCWTISTRLCEGSLNDWVYPRQAMPENRYCVTRIPARQAMPGNEYCVTRIPTRIPEGNVVQFKQGDD